MGTKLTKNYRVGNKQNTEFDFSKVEGIHPLTAVLQKKRVQQLIEHSTSHQLLCYVDSFELRIPLLRKAAKR